MNHPHATYTPPSEVIDLSKLLSNKYIRDGLLAFALCLSALSLMCFPQESMSAVRNGLTLCYNVIIPSLFPFFVLSTLVVDLGLARYLGRMTQGIMEPLFRVPGVCSSAFILGFIGGYPVGAKTAIELYEKGHCNKTEAERLLAFCNNSGPAFILGVVGAGIFVSSSIGLLLHLAHGLASVCVGLLFRFYGKSEPSRYTINPHFDAQRGSVAFTNAIKSSFFSTLNICAFVTFFTVVIEILFISNFLPTLAHLLALVLAPFGFTVTLAQQFITGLIELSSGVWTLADSGSMVDSLPMAAFMLGWAGLSVHCQVLSFLSSSGLSSRTYFLGKLLHGGLSALIVSLLYRVLPLNLEVSTFIAYQTNTVSNLEFPAVFTSSCLVAGALFITLVTLSGARMRKTCGKKKHYVV